MMRRRTVGLSTVAGLALAAGLAVGGRAQGGDGAVGGVRAEPRAADLRLDDRPLHGPLVRAAERGTGDHDSLHLGLLKGRALPSTARVAVVEPAVRDRLPWAVRSYVRPLVTGGHAGKVRIDRTRPGIRCAQLGRLRSRTFGWVRPSGSVFRPLAAETDLLTVCSTDAGPSGIASNAVVLPDRDPYDPGARVRATTVWGLAPRSASRVRVSWAGWTRTVSVHAGVFLATGPAPRSAFVDRGAHVVDVRRPVRRTASGAAPRSPGTVHRGRGGLLANNGFGTAGDPRIAARLVDPATGRPSAVVTGTIDGRPCDGGVAPLAAGVVGDVEPGAQTISGGGRLCQVIQSPRRGAAPVLRGFGGGIGDPTEDGPDLVGRERLVPGGFAVTVLTPPDVVRVELRSAGDVRTVRPVAPGIVHALYDGSAIGGGGLVGTGVDVIGIRADGSRVRALGPGKPLGVTLGSAELGGP